MNCPIDNAKLAITERQGIEIDYCPECRGVWLDRGELDKIIDKSAAYQPRPEPEQYRQSEPRRDYDDRHHSQPKKKKRENFLGDLFEF